jgi:predicted O-methyltransferase YrrM
MNKEELSKHIAEMLLLREQIEGHLSPIEARFIATLPFVKGEGTVLEIGSFKGKSTILLAQTARTWNLGKIHACDPLFLSSSTDPQEARGQSVEHDFYTNIRRHGVEDQVVFHQMKSAELARAWTLPLRALWIDGDHTYAGALADFELFNRHLVPGSVVALHDVLHDFDGPIRVFAEKMLLSGQFGHCGIVGSIAWGQFLGTGKPSPGQWKAKLSLYRSVQRVIPYVVASANGIPSSKLAFKTARALVPHRRFNALSWVQECNAFGN